ncbi:MAG: A/G-specific adenine glycosylase [Acidimicrobiales bacterium]
MHSNTISKVFLWWDSEKRDLPWRISRDPWAILVSEFMLQQTQASRVVEKYKTFLKRFPNPTTCANSTPGKVIELWSGLGYNRRAINLHRTAKTIAEKHKGTVPDELSLLLDLPGIGDYTARAILAFSFEKDVAVVDVNVKRVLSRLEGRTLSMKEAQSIADQNLPTGEGWRWNQAMIEIGATICTARKTQCGKCPLKATCTWTKNQAATDPAISVKSKKLETFEGSDRQGRGKLINALRNEPIMGKDVPQILGWPNDHKRCKRVLEKLEKDGLIVIADSGKISLPNG